MVTIRDIKMPVNCEECFARVLAWCRLDEEERIVVPAVPWELEERQEWCPLVDISDEAGNCSEIPNNSDYISRQDTLALWDKYHYSIAIHAMEYDEELRSLPSVQPTLREQALMLLLNWAVECDFGYDNFPEEYERYKGEIEDMSYFDGMIYIAEKEVERNGCNQQTGGD